MAVQDIVYEIGGDAAALVSAGAAGAKALRQTDKAAQVLKKQLDGLSSANVAYQRSVGAAVGVTDGFAKSAKASAAVFQRDWDSASASVNRLRSSLDPLYASSKRYEAAVNSLDAAVRKGVITETERVRLLGLAEQAYLQAGNAAAVSGARATGLAGVMSRNGQSIQMVGYQVQDMAVQLAAGQSAMVVFAQQGSQIASAFGPMGAVIGTIAAVSLPLIGAAFMSASSKAMTFDEALNALEQSLTDLNAIASAYTAEGVQALIDKYGELNSKVLEHIELQRQEAMRTALENSRVALAALYDEMDSGVLALWQQDIDTAMGSLEDLFGGTEEEVRGLYTALLDAKRAATFDEQVAAMTRLRDRIIETTGGIENMTGEQFAFFQKVNDSLDAMLQLKAAAPKAGGLPRRSTARRRWPASCGMRPRLRRRRRRPDRSMMPGIPFRRAFRAATGHGLPHPGSAVSIGVYRPAAAAAAVEKTRWSAKSRRCGSR